MKFDLKWVVANYGSFFERFGLNHDKLMDDYKAFKKNSPKDSVIENFVKELFRQVALYNIKHADTEEDYANNNIEIITKKLELFENLPAKEKLELLRQLHFNKLLASKATLPFDFNVQIKSANCCSYCGKQNGKIYSFENVLRKKYIPHEKCKHSEGCKCSYLIVPLINNDNS